MVDRRRQLARVTSVSYDEDHGTVWVMLEFGAGCQGFGGLAFARTADREKFVDAVRRVLCVPYPVSMTGAVCYALYSRGDNNESIEGIESLDGALRLTVTGFLRSLGEEVSSARDRERESLESTVRWAERRAAQARAELATLDARTVDWGDGNVTARMS